MGNCRSSCYDKPCILPDVVMVDGVEDYLNCSANTRSGIRCEKPDGDNDTASDNIEADDDKKLVTRAAGPEQAAVEPPTKCQTNEEDDLSITSILSPDNDQRSNRQEESPRRRPSLLVGRRGSSRRSDGRSNSIYSNLSGSLSYLHRSWSTLSTVTGIGGGEQVGAGPGKSIKPLNTSPVYKELPINAERIRVREVYEGTSVRLVNDVQVKLIGVDTPDGTASWTSDSYSRDVAKRYTYGLCVEMQTYLNDDGEWVCTAPEVWISYDPDCEDAHGRRDHFGRLLCYVWVRYHKQRVSGFSNMYDCFGGDGGEPAYDDHGYDGDDCFFDANSKSTALKRGNGEGSGFLCVNEGLVAEGLALAFCPSRAVSPRRNSMGGDGNYRKTKRLSMDFSARSVSSVMSGGRSRASSLHLPSSPLHNWEKLLALQHRARILQKGMWDDFSDHYALKVLPRDRVAQSSPSVACCYHLRSCYHLSRVDYAEECMASDALNQGYYPCKKCLG